MSSPRARAAAAALVAIGAGALAATTAITAGCGGPAGPVTASELPTTPRRPDGVVIEPTPALPAPSERAPARGVVALREPLGEEAAREAVRAYVGAFEREDLDALETMLDPEAVALDPRARRSRAGVVEAWRARFKQLDYGHIAGTEIVSLDRVEHFESEDLGVPGAPQRPDVMRPGDLLVRAPVTTPRVAGERYFGDTILLLLRRQEGGGFVIAGVAEDGF